jgi:NAD(P)-dependent dehydrogenase (short-subunit alcohol dehydrogenase family)
MTTAVIGTGGLGWAIARRLAAGGENLRLSNADRESAQALAADVAGWLPAGARLAMAFGTMSAGLLESSSRRSPEPAVLFYATVTDRRGVIGAASIAYFHSKVAVAQPDSAYVR